MIYLIKKFLFVLGMTFFIQSTAYAQSLDDYDQPTIHFAGIYKGHFAGKKKADCDHRHEATGNKILDLYFSKICETYPTLLEFEEFFSAPLPGVKFSVLDVLEEDVCSAYIAFLTLDEVFIFPELFRNSQGEPQYLRINLYPFFTYYIFRLSDRMMAYSRQIFGTADFTFEDLSALPNPSEDILSKENIEGLATRILNDQDYHDKFFKESIKTIVKKVSHSNMAKNSVSGLSRYKLQGEEEALSMGIVKLKVIDQNQIGKWINNPDEFNNVSSYLASARFGNEIPLLPFYLSGDRKFDDFDKNINIIVNDVLNNILLDNRVSADANKEFLVSPCGKELKLGRKMFPEPVLNVQVLLKLDKKVKKSIREKGVLYSIKSLARIMPARGTPEIEDDIFIDELKKKNKKPLLFWDQIKKDIPITIHGEPDIHFYIGLTNAFFRPGVSLVDHYGNKILDRYYFGQ